MHSYQFWTDIHGHQRIDQSDFGDPLINLNCLQMVDICVFSWHVLTAIGMKLGKDIPRGQILMTLMIP